MLNFELIGKRFSELRNRSGFTQSQLAEYLDVDQSYISKCEKNERQFSTDVLEKAADMFASYFLTPYEALSYFIKNKLKKEKHQLEIEDVIKIEQNYGMSRQAILWRLVNDGYISPEKADTMKIGIITSARKLGYDDELYTPTPEDKQHATFGKYIKLAEELKGLDIISQGKYEELLLNGFRSDIVYGLNTEEEELYD